MPFCAILVVAFVDLPALLGCDVEHDVFAVVLSGFGFCVLSEAADEDDFVEHGVWLRFFWCVRCLRYMLARRVCRRDHSLGGWTESAEGDSMHIADDVVTIGLTHGIARLEASGFHGREPDEFRWDLDSGKIDSWSTRLTVQPGKNWRGQYSYARIASPEALFPNENQARTTASAMYNRPFEDGNWARTALWGRTRSLSDSEKENSYLLESLVRFKVSNYAWTRIENAGRTNELENGPNPLPPNFQERLIGTYSLHRRLRP